HSHNVLGAIWAAVRVESVNVVNEIVDVDATRINSCQRIDDILLSAREGRGFEFRGWVALHFTQPPPALPACSKLRRRSSGKLQTSRRDTGQPSVSPRLRPVQTSRARMAWW